MNDKNLKPVQNNNASESTENVGINKWLLIGGAVVLGLLLLRLVFSFGDGSAQVTPTPSQPNNGIVAPFVGPVWEWTQTTDAAGTILTVPNPAQYTMQFLANGTYQGKADCNSITGAYSVNGSAIQL